MAFESADPANPNTTAAEPLPTDCSILSVSVVDVLSSGDDTYAAVAGTYHRRNSTRNAKPWFLELETKRMSIQYSPPNEWNLLLSNDVLYTTTTQALPLKADDEYQIFQSRFRGNQYGNVSLDAYLVIECKYPVIADPDIVSAVADTVDDTLHNAQFWMVFNSILLSVILCSMVVFAVWFFRYTHSSGMTPLQSRSGTHSPASDTNMHENGAHQNDNGNDIATNTRVAVSAAITHLQLNNEEYVEEDEHKQQMIVATDIGSDDSSNRSSSVSEVQQLLPSDNNNNNTNTNLNV